MARYEMVMGMNSTANRFLYTRTRVGRKTHSECKYKYTQFIELFKPPWKVHERGRFSESVVSIIIEGLESSKIISLGDEPSNL